MIIALVVAARILANPLSNVFQKQLAQRQAGPLFVVGVTHALLTVPALLLLAVGPPLPTRPGFGMNMAIAAMLAVAGNAMLVLALERGDLSVLGPINAFKALVSMALATVLIGELPTPAGLTGMLLILGGTVFVIDQKPDERSGQALRGFLRDPAVRLRFWALGLSATEAVFLKRAILLSSPLASLVWWSILGCAVAGLILAAGYRDRIRTELEGARLHRRTFVWLAITTGVMQGATLLAFRSLQVGYALALFQLSALVSVLLGYRYFQERRIGRRFIGAAVMVAGAALIVMAGRRG